MFKYKRKITFVVLCLFSLASIASFVFATDGGDLGGDNETEIVASTSVNVMVRPTPSAPSGAYGSFAVSTSDEWEEIAPQVSALTVDETDIPDLKSDSSIEYIEIDAKVRKASLDEYWNMSAMDIPRTRELQYLGDGVKIALLDTGIDLNSSQYHIAGGVSFVDGVASYADDNGHGTAMASVIASDALGIAPNAGLYSVKVLDAYGEGHYSNVIQGIYWAIEQNVDIINMSFGADDYSLFLEEAVGAAFDAGITLIGAVGNTGADRVQYPAKYTNVIGVGAVNEDGTAYEYSNTGDGLNVFAPGENIRALSVGDFGVGSKGTSIAAAQVSGIAALIKNAKNDLTAAETMAVIKKGAVSAENTDAGIINAWKALSNINLYIENADDYLPIEYDPTEETNGNGAVTASAANISEYDNQYINVNNSFTVKAKFDSQHSNVRATVYNVNSPSTIINSQYFYNINGTPSNPYTVTYTCPTGYLSSLGTYKVRFHASSNSTDAYDNVYTIYVTEDQLEVESNNSRSTADPIDGFAKSFYGRITSTSDVDYVSFYVYAGEVINAQLSRLPFDYDLYLYNPGGDIKARPYESGTRTENITYTADVTGYWYLMVDGYGNQSYSQYKLDFYYNDIYESHVIFGTSVNNNNSYSNATSIPVVSTETINAVIASPTDLDFYKITAPQGTLTLRLDNLVKDYDLFLFSAAPDSTDNPTNYLKKSANGRSDPETITYTVSSATQDLYIFVKGFNNVFDRTNYRLKITFALEIYPQVSNITKNSAAVSWNTPFSGSSVVNYGTTTSVASSKSSLSNVTSHNVNVTSLSNAAKYYYKAKSINGLAGVESEMSSFVTRDQYEPNDSRTSSVYQLSQEMIEATLDSYEDNDYYKIVLSGLSTVTFGLNTIPSGCDYDIQILDVNGNLVGWGGNPLNNPETVNITLGAGTYYVLIESATYNATIAPTQKYKLTYSYSQLSYSFISAVDELHFGGDGTYTATGNFSRTYADLPLVNSAFDYAVGRTYNSKDNISTHFGRGWMFSVEGKVADLERKILYSNGTVSTITDSNYKMAKLPDGSQYIFKLESGAYIAQDSRNKLVKNSDNSFTLTLPNQNQYLFNSNGYLTAIKDKHGNAISISVNSSGKVQSFTEPTGNSYIVGYHSNGFVSSVTEQIGGANTGRVISYAYNSSARLTSVTDAMGIVTNYVYDSDGYLSEIRNGQNTLLEKAEYVSVSNEPKKVWKHTNEFGMVTTYTYTPSQNKTASVDSNGRTSEQSYDDKKFITSQKDGLNRVIETKYFTESGGANKYGEVEWRIDENGNKTAYERDSAGNTTKEIHPDGTFREFHYDGKNNVDWERSETGRFTVYEYNTNKDKLVKKAKYLLPLTSGTVTLTTANQDNFAIEEYIYYPDNKANIKALLHKYTDPLGIETEYDYNQKGNPVSVKDPETQEITAYEYNNINLKTASITPRGYRTEYLYDRGYNLVKETEVTTGAVKRTVFDAYGEKIQEISPKQYNSAQDNLTTFAYSDTSAGTRYEYNSNGTLKKTTTPEGDVTEILEYDGYGNIKRESLPKQYGENGELQTDYAQYAYEYDAANRLKKKYIRETPTASDVLIEETVYTVTQTGTQYFPIETKTVRHTSALSSATATKRDYAGRIVLVTNPDSSAVSTAYYGDGKILSQTDGRNNTAYYKYNEFDSANWQTYDGVWKPVEGGYSYSRAVYDKSGLKIQEKQGLQIAASQTALPTSYFTTTHEYYDNGKLKKTTDSEGRRGDYWYDNDGNLSKEELYASPTEKNTIEYINNSIGKVFQKKIHVNPDDLYNDSRSVLITETLYDLNGNPVTVTTPDDEETIFAYDNQNRQTGVTKTITGEDGEPATVTTEILYNPADKPRYTKDANGNETRVIFNAKGFAVKAVNSDGTAYAEYDLSGRMTAEVKPKFYNPAQNTAQMNRTEYEYDNMSRLYKKIEKYQENGGWVNTTVKTFLYDANGNLESEKDALENETTYAYTPDNQIKTIKDPVTADRGIDFTYSYTYNALGQKASETNAKGATTKFYYDAAGNQTGKAIVINGAERQLEGASYDYLGNVKTLTDGEGNVTHNYYNAFNKLRSAVMPSDATIAENTVQHKYDCMGNLAWKQDSTGATEISTFDERGKPLSKTVQKSDGTESVSVSSLYDGNGNVRFSTDGKGNVTENAYDGQNRLTSQSLAGKSKTYRFDPNGNNYEVEDWLGNTVKTEFDPLNRIKVRKDAFDKTIETIEYTLNGLQWKSENALGKTTEYQYDKNGRLLKAIDPLGNETLQTYDDTGNIDSKTDGNEKAQILHYDELNRLDWVQATVGGVNEITSYTYDWNGNATSQTDGEGNITTTLYNAQNLPKLKYDDDGENDPAKQESYTYYPNGLMAAKLDRGGKTTNYEYYAQGRLKSQSVGDETVSYEYDGNGNQTKLTDSTGDTIRLYDAFNRAYSKTQPNVGAFSYLYDQTDSLTSGYYAEITTDPKGNTAKKVFDKMGKLYQVFDNGSTTPTQYEYYDNGALERITYANGAKEEYAYFDDGNLETLQNKLPSGAVTDSYSYTYDGAGNQTSKTETIAGVSKGVTSYTYDDLSRLKTVTEPNGKSTVYAFDKAGNRKTETITENGASVQTIYHYNGQNRLNKTVSTEGGTEVTFRYYYDNNGNLSSKTKEFIADAGTGPSEILLNALGVSQDEFSQDAHLYEYNGFNQMTTAYVGATKTTYAYNGEGLRVSKSSGNTIIRYGYEYEKVVLELDGAGSQTARNLYGINLINRTADGVTLFYQFNGHADITALTDANGTVTASYYYDAFGVTTSQSGGADNPFRYAGYEFDKETGLYYLKSRFYDAKIARFTQSDSYTGNNSDPLSLNLYTYVLNNPLRYLDPTGMIPNEIKINGKSIGYLQDFKTGIYGSLGDLVNIYGGSVSKDGYVFTAKVGNFKFVLDTNGIGVLKSGEDVTRNMEIYEGDNFYAYDHFVAVQDKAYPKTSIKLLVNVDKFANILRPVKDYTVNKYYTSLDTFLTDLSDVGLLAIGYNRNNTVARQLVFQQLRSSKYSGGNWDVVAGAIDNDFTNFLRSTRGDLNFEGQVFLKDPSSGYNIDINHLAYTINAGLYISRLYSNDVSSFGKLIKTLQVQGTGDKILDDLAGWARDLQSLYANLNDKQPSNDETALYNTAYSLFGTVGSNFGMSDVLADVDAVNLVKLLKSDNSKRIKDIFNDYYTSGAKTRFFSFQSAIFGDGSTNDYYANKLGMVEKVKFYTNEYYLNVVTWPIIADTKKRDVTQSQSNALAKAFVDYIEYKVNQELANIPTTLSPAR
jgi:RHS repeat-associated protein